MLHNIRDEHFGVDSPGSGTPSLDLETILSTIRRRWPIVAVSVLAGLFAGIGFLLTAVPLYTASATLLIDKSNAGLISEIGEIGAAVNDDAAVLSEVEVLRSDTVALSVVDKYRLQDNSLFMSAGQSLRASISQFLDLRRVFSDLADDQIVSNEARENAASLVKANMSVSRVGRTYVLDISYRSRSPELSSKIVNAIAEAYLVDKLNSKYDATRRAGTWLQQRTDELRQQALESDMAAQRFRTSNGLLTTSGQLVSDQQLTELNRALVAAQAETARAGARYDRVRAIVDSNNTGAIVTEMLDSVISNDLRKKYLDASKTEAEISARLGSNHVQAVRLRSQMAEYERLMFAELGRIAASYRSEYDIARSRENSLLKSVADATKVSAAAGETQVQLRELERNAEAYKNLYQTFLARSQEATQQQSFPITEARIIEKAQAPTVPSYPKKPMTLGLFGVLGAALGLSGAAFLEYRDKFFRTGEQVRTGLQTNFLGFIPLIDEPVLGYVNRHPMSMVAETIRAAKLAVELRDNIESRVVGIISALPGEGKSSTAIHLAQLLGNQGFRTLYVDGDFRHPGGSRVLAPASTRGLAEVLSNRASMSDVLVSLPESNIDVVPAVVDKQYIDSAQLLSSKQMGDFLTSAKSRYQYIVIDLPPIGPVVDARAVAKYVDSFIVIVEWGRTARKLVQTVLAEESTIRSKIVGAVLNKVDVGKLKLYRTPGSAEDYHSRYLEYYRQGR